MGSPRHPKGMPAQTMLLLHPERTGLFLSCSDSNTSSQTLVLHLQPSSRWHIHLGLPSNELWPHTLYLRTLRQRTKHFHDHKFGDDVEKTHFSERIHVPGTLKLRCSDHVLWTSFLSNSALYLPSNSCLSLKHKYFVIPSWKATSLSHCDIFQLPFPRERCRSENVILFLTQSHILFSEEMGQRWPEIPHPCLQSTLGNSADT